METYEPLILLMRVAQSGKGQTFRRLEFSGKIYYNPLLSSYSYHYV